MKCKPGDILKVRVLETSSSGITEIEVVAPNQKPQRFAVLQPRRTPLKYPIRQWRKDQAKLDLL
jgi:hypothetical protein